MGTENEVLYKKIKVLTGKLGAGKVKNDKLSAEVMALGAELRRVI